MRRQLGWIAVPLVLACSSRPPGVDAPTEEPRTAPTATPVDPNAPRAGGRSTCPITLRDDPAWNALWPRCPLYYPAVTIGAECGTPRCMRPCLVEVSSGPDSDALVLQYWYWYDDAGRATRSLTIGMGGKIDRSYRYDEAGRVAQTVRVDGGGTVYRYDAFGRLAGWTRTDPHLSAMVLSATHGPWGPLEITTTEGGEVIERQRYSYSDDGSIETEEDYDNGRFSMRQGDPTKTFRLRYDEAGRIGGFGDGNSTTSVERDSAGRIATVQRNHVTTTSLEYDAEGRLTVVDQRKIVVEGYTELRYDCTGLDPDEPAPPPELPPELPPTVRCRKPVPPPKGKPRVAFTQLMIAAANGRLDEVRSLVDGGADLDAVDDTLGTPAIASAISNGHDEVVRHLLAKGASVDPAGDNSPLRSALIQSRGEAVALLLKGCADPNRATKYKELPLELAIEHFPVYSNYSASESSHEDERRHLMIVQRLLDAGARVDVTPRSAASYQALVRTRFEREGIDAHYKAIGEKIAAMIAAAKR